MKPSLGRIVHVKPGPYALDPTFSPTEWHAALVVREPFDAGPDGECFGVQVFSRVGASQMPQTHSVSGENRTWRWPPREGT